MSVKEGTELQKKKRRGRRPMTADEKAAAAAARAEEKVKADNLAPEIFIEYQDTQTSVNALTEAAKADFRSKKKRTLITKLELYVKPQDNAAYYVINDKYSGKVDFSEL